MEAPQCIHTQSVDKRAGQGAVLSSAFDWILALGLVDCLSSPNNQKIYCRKKEIRRTERLNSTCVYIDIERERERDDIGDLINLRPKYI